jgi:aldehyde dehydrogenase (NAD+)
MSDTATHLKQNYIGGQWVDSKGGKSHDVINPATEEAASTIVLGTAADVDDAVAAAREALKSWSQTSREERLALLEPHRRGIQEAHSPISHARWRAEMGAPISFADRGAGSCAGIGGFLGTIAALKNFDFTERQGKTLRDLRTHRRRAVMITPWNWPLNQIVAQARAGARCRQHGRAEAVGAAAATRRYLAEVLHDAGVPKGVFNLVKGSGPVVGEAIARIPISTW